MAMYPDDKEGIINYITLECAQCKKFCGVYFGTGTSFFKELFFCSLKCEADHKKEKKK